LYYILFGRPFAEGCGFEVIIERSQKGSYDCKKKPELPPLSPEIARDN